MAATPCPFVLAIPNAIAILTRPEERELPAERELSGDLNGRITAWRDRARALAGSPDCDSCAARGTCRRCPSFLANCASDVEAGYCDASRSAHRHLKQRIESALKNGFDWLHASRDEHREKYNGRQEACNARQEVGHER